MPAYVNISISAPGSAQEVYAQLLIASDLQKISEQHRAIELANRLIAQLTVFIQRLKPQSNHKARSRYTTGAQAPALNV